MPPAVRDVRVPGQHVDLELADVVAREGGALLVGGEVDLRPFVGAGFPVVGSGVAEVGVDDFGGGGGEEAGVEPIWAEIWGCESGTGRG